MEGIGRVAINATLDIFRFIELGTRKAENIPLQLFPTHSLGVGTGNFLQIVYISDLARL